MVMDPIPCYITDKNTGATVSFDIAVPDSITDSYTANFENQFTKGRSSPFKAFQNSGPRSVSFTVRLSLDYRRDLLAVVNSLREMLKPSHSSYIVAPYVHVRIGDVLNIDAVPVSFDANWSSGYKESTYRICECSFSFDMVENHGTFDKSKSSQYQYGTTNTRPALEANSGSKGKGLGLNLSGSADLGKTLEVTGTRIGCYYKSDVEKKTESDRTLKIPPGKYKVVNKEKNLIQIEVPRGSNRYDRVWLDPHGDW